MWYVIQTVGGQEQTVRALIERQLFGEGGGLVEQCFIPMRERTVKRGGEWKLVQEKLFPGYVFVVTEEAQRLMQELKSIPRFARLLGTGANEFVPLRPEEVALFQRFDDSDYVARLSQVEVVEGGRIRILSGALVNCEGMITKVHLHKRVAEVRTQFMGRAVDLYLGFELLGRPADSKK
ncbi:MAG: antiterminator LoaP [Candidatus Faecivicinus sp.]